MLVEDVVGRETFVALLALMAALVVSWSMIREDEVGAVSIDWSDIVKGGELSWFT